MLRNRLTILINLAVVCAANGQQASAPQVKVNVLNVCTPSADEQQQIANALSLVPKQASFSPDFEVDRGRSLLDQSPGVLLGGQDTHVVADSGTADWVRMRREFVGHNQFSRVQYSFSRDPKSMVETLVFVVRDPKDLMQLVIEDSSSPVTSAADMLRADSPASRIKLERFGKASVVLARCSGTEDKPAPDQTAYEPLFQSASRVAAEYRTLLGVRNTVPQELARLNRPALASKGTTKKSASGSKK